MFRIKRVKTSGEGKAAVTAVHFATAVTPRGTIDGWDKSPDKAVAVTEGVAKRVQAFHLGRRNIGELHFEPVEVSGATLAQAVAADDAVGAAEFAAIQKRCRVIDAENAELKESLRIAKQSLDAAVQDAKKAAAAAKEAGDRIAEREAEIVAAGERNASLAARVADLEKQLAEAHETAKAKKQQAGK
jgi:hypothetical protein